MPEEAQNRDAQARCAAASYDAPARSLQLTMRNGARLSLPVQGHALLGRAPEAALGTVEVSPDGLQLRWPALRHQERLAPLVMLLLGFGGPVTSRVPPAAGPVPGAPKSLLGLLMYREGHLTREQLQGLFQEQMRLQQSGTQVPLGQLAVRSGFITEAQLTGILKVQEQLGAAPPPVRALTIFLLESASVAPSALVAALQAQPQSGQPLEALLMQRGLLSENQLAVYQSRQRPAAPAGAAVPVGAGQGAPARPQAPPKPEGPVKSLLGIILEREDYLSQAQVQAIVAEQERLKAGGKTSSFGELAEKLGFITQEQLRFAISLQQKLAYAPGQGKPLGATLLENGVVKPSQIHLALQKQQATGQRLGQILIEQGAISENLLEVFLKMQQPG